jgi:hypothetical protein
MKPHSRTKKRTQNPGWPYYKLFISPQIMETRIKEMRRLKYKISNKPRRPLALILKTHTIPHKFNGKYISFIDDNYLKYDVLPLVYSEPELLKCQFRGQPSPLTQYSNPATAQKLWREFRDTHNIPRTTKKLSTARITHRQQTSKHTHKHTQNKETFDEYDKKNLILLEQYREFLYSKIKACNNYRPTLAQQTYWFLGQQLQPPKSTPAILDFSAGWGDRLFAACVGQNKYIGLDPNINNRRIYDTIIRNHGSLAKQRVITTGAEYLPDQILQKNMLELGIQQFDLIATSPPFYDYEIYSDTAQSAMGFIDAPRWLIFWLGQVIHKYMPFLHPGGYLALYIQDTDRNTFVEPLTLFILSNPTEFSGLVCCGLIHSTRFPMIVFQKPNQQETKQHKNTHKSYPSTTAPPTANKYQKIFQITYPKHAKAAKLWLATHHLLTDINTNSLTRTVIKYLINRTGQIAYIPDTLEYINLAQEFKTRPQPIPNSTPEKLDKLFMELWRESIQEYKLSFGQKPETNIHPLEYREIYNNLFNSND